MNYFAESEMMDRRNLKEMMPMPPIRDLPGTDQQHMGDSSEDEYSYYGCKEVQVTFCPRYKYFGTGMHPDDTEDIVAAPRRDDNPEGAKTQGWFYVVTLFSSFTVAMLLIYCLAFNSNLKDSKIRKISLYMMFACGSVFLI
eukprot:UN27471